LIGAAIHDSGIGECVWYLDSPVSNSGHLKALIEEIAARHQWNWRVRVVVNPDAILSEAADPVVSADSVILDRCGPWVNLARRIVSSRIPSAWVVEMSPDPQCV
jgi:hypothetical protein